MDKAVNALVSSDSCGLFQAISSGGASDVETEHFGCVN